MKQAQASHPSSEQLLAFGQGRLDPTASGAIERHIESCETCCQVLRSVPNDTLVDVLRAGLAEGGEAGDGDFVLRSDVEFTTQAGGPADSAANRTVPPELAEHPRYQVIELLGVGGMGAVYKAVHRLMERPVALKLITPAFLRSHPNAVERFRVEVRAAAKLSHPNIVAAHDAEQAGDLHFLVMEYVEGITLQRLVEKRGPLPVLHACHYCRQAALGLQHAHQHGMVHRDIKPQNLMLTRKGQVKILDFGLARFAGEQLPADGQGSGDTDPRRPAPLTMVGVVMGTPDFIAPEQATAASKADIRSDIFSLGSTLYYLLTARPPFAPGSFMDMVLSGVKRVPEPLAKVRPDLPAELSQIVERMIDNDPARRYQTPVEVAQALFPFARGSVPVPPLVPTSPAAVSQPSPVALPQPLLDELATGPPIRFREDEPPRRTGRRRHKPQWRRSGPRKTSWVVGILLLAVAAAAIGVAVWGGKTPGSTPTPVTGANPGAASEKKPEPPPAPPAGTKRVVIVLAHQNFWYDDYAPVRRILEEAGVQVRVASWTLDASMPEPKSGADARPVQPDLLLKDVKAADFDAVVFCGGMGFREYTPLPSPLNRPHSPARAKAPEEARRVIHEFIAADRYVTAVCRGPAILLMAGALGGHKFTEFGEAKQYAEKFGAIWAEDEGVVESGRFITCRRPAEAPELARKLLEKLR